MKTKVRIPHLLTVLCLVQITLIVCRNTPTYGEYEDEYPSDYDYGASERGYLAIEPSPGTTTTDTTTTTPITPVADMNNYKQLTPSAFIRDFVESLLRNRNSGSSESDSAEVMERNFSANPGFQAHWPGGEWAAALAHEEECNSTGVDCGEAYDNFGVFCASNRAGRIETFDTYCEMTDENCRDGIATTWTMGTPASLTNFSWFRVEGSTVLFDIMTHDHWEIVLSDKKGSIPKESNHQGYVLSYGYWHLDTYNTIKIRPNASTSYAYHIFNLDPAVKIGRFVRFSPEVHQFKIEFRSRGVGEGSVLSLQLNDHALNGTVVATSYSHAEFDFEWRWVGIAGGNIKQPTFWHMSAWLPVYKGVCQGAPSTIQMHGGDPYIRNRIEVLLYNMAERLVEFGYNTSTRTSP